MPKIFAGLDRGELLTIGGLVAGSAAAFWGLSKINTGGGGDDIALINPATATPDQSTVPEGGGLSDYWSYNQPAYYTAPASLPVQSTNAPTSDGGQPGYTGPDFASYLLSNLANLLGGGAGSNAATSLTNLWLGNTASATPQGTPAPTSTAGAPPTNTPIIQVPPVAPYTPAALSPPPPPMTYSPPPAAPVQQQSLGLQRAAY